MQSLASFSTIKARKSYYVRVKNFRRDTEELFFQFDTGAALSLIGLNTICDKSIEDQNILRNIILKEINENGIEAHQDSPKTVTEEEVIVYPCRLDGVSIMGTTAVCLYFYIFLGNVNMPLLGYDYVDDCCYRHSIGGNIEVMAIADNVGRKHYPQKIINFNKVLDEYYRIKVG